MIRNIEMWISDISNLPKTILYICSLSLLYTAPYVFSLIYRIIKTYITNCQNTKSVFVAKNKKANFIIIVIFLIGVAYLPFCLFNCGNTTFGSIFEKKHYTEDFYVFITDDTSNSKRYKVRATIEKTSPSITENLYFLKTVYWNNGGYISFADSGYLGEPVLPNKETCVTDNYDRDYYVTLTTEKVK